VFIAVPSRFCRSVFREIGPVLKREQIVVSLTKGIEEGSLKRMTEVMAEVFQPAGLPRLAVLSGPSFAREVAEKHPTAVVIAAARAESARTVQRLVSDIHFRAYTSADVAGVELAGALKNVIAVACGISDALRFGHNTRAALITRGIAEISRLALKFGARKETFLGLAGMATWSSPAPRAGAATITSGSSSGKGGRSARSSTRRPWWLKGLPRPFRPWIWPAGNMSRCRYQPRSFEFFTRIKTPEIPGGVDAANPERGIIGSEERDEKNNVDGDRFGSLSDGLRVLQKKLQQAKDKDPQYQYSMGAVYLNNNNLDEAIRLFNKALSLNPRHFQSLNALGLAYSLKGDLKEAEKFFLKCLEISPAFTEARNNLGMIYQEMGFPDRAEEEYKKAAADATYASKELPYYNLARLYSLRMNWETALFYAEKAIQTNARYHLGHALRGYILENQEKLPEAIESYKQAVRLLRAMSPTNSTSPPRISRTATSGKPVKFSGNPALDHRPGDERKGRLLPEDDQGEREVECLAARLKNEFAF